MISNASHSNFGEINWRGALVNTKKRIFKLRYPQRKRIRVEIPPNSIKRDYFLNNCLRNTIFFILICNLYDKNPILSSRMIHGQSSSYMTSNPRPNEIRMYAFSIGCPFFSSIMPMALMQTSYK